MHLRVPLLHLDALPESQGCEARNSTAACGCRQAIGVAIVAKQDWGKTPTPHST